MEDVIELQNIRCNVYADDWKDAIRKAGSLLVDDGKIDPQYIENMIKSVETLGPYIVLMPGFALGHAEPCPEVFKTSLSLITLADDVCFGSPNDPVRVVMCLACTDKQSHMSKIQTIAMKLMQDNAIENILACKDEEELYRFFNELG